MTPKHERLKAEIDELDTNPPPLPAAEPKETAVLTVEIEWAEPPAAKPNGRHQSEAIDAVVSALQQRPGQWAAVKRGMASTSGCAAFKKRGCETVVRRGTDSPEGGARYDIYARWPA